MAVPLVGAVVVVRVVAVQEPAVAEVSTDLELVVLEDRQVDVAVIAGLPADPGIDRPAAAQRPRRTEAGQQVRHAPNRLGRLRRGSLHVPTPGATDAAARRIAASKDSGSGALVSPAANAASPNRSSGVRPEASSTPIAGAPSDLGSIEPSGAGRSGL